LSLALEASSFEPLSSSLLLFELLSLSPPPLLFEMLSSSPPPLLFELLSLSPTPLMFEMLLSSWDKWGQCYCTCFLIASNTDAVARRHSIHIYIHVHFVLYRFHAHSQTSNLRSMSHTTTMLVSLTVLN
jgi:hypothetical protein